MKKSIVVSTQPASFSAVAYKGKLEENLLNIKNLGYDGAELAIRDPALIDIVSLKRCLDLHQLSTPLSTVPCNQPGYRHSDPALGSPPQIWGTAVHHS